ncbi:family 16 glycosylhydrolase [Halosolutus gelatinilyticus]|uniref:family 16 glycosylhydrolase n=1 Tax=Halosolutus gelatinilyticus TaxID=2931975 RepID=UPI001FF1DF41|nr:family 16 glycosylhydrolase [Halosolutus gelatinilyticus]
MPRLDREASETDDESRAPADSLQRRGFLGAAAAVAGTGFAISTASAAPYAPNEIPGRIQAENYDTGGQGATHYDTTDGNAGGAYRDDHVDIEPSVDGGYNVGWIQPDEWLEYTVDVQSSGTYDLTACVASLESGGQFHVEVDGANATGPVSFGATGDWHAWTTVDAGSVDFSAGEHVIRVYSEAAGWNLDWLEFRADGDDELDGRSWTLTWSDEFDQGSIDDSVWSYDLGNGQAVGVPGWGNEESQYYQRENSWIENNRLVIEAREEHVTDEYGSYDYTSARMKTMDGVNKQYGRIDVRARLPQGQGIWPAIWSLGSTGTWPDSGEIDITELVGHEPSIVHGTVHGPEYLGEGGISGSYTLQNGTFADGFHDFSIVWDPDEITWFVDGEQYHTVTRAEIEGAGNTWVFDKPFYILLNVAVGGEWPGYPDQTTTFPQRMEVEYVRFYDEA